MKKMYLFTVLFCVLALNGFSQIFEKQGAGVTIITHGWNPSGGEPGWIQPMAEAIIERSGGNGHIANITVAGSLGNLTATCTNWDFDFSSTDYCEIVVIVNWTAVANHLTTRIPAQDVAAVVAPKIYESQNGKPALAELPIHLIGHSRGGGLIFQIAKLLGQQGIEVEQVTSLDPHPLTSADPQSTPQTIDASIVLFENILFVDSYYQNIEFPTGQYLTNAYNRLWTSLPGGYHNESGYTYNILGTDYNFSDHLNIILAYHGTIDLATPVNNGEATMTTTERAWFNDFENTGENTGFIYSRNLWGNRLSEEIPVNGGDQINYGYHNDPLLGGAGNRVANIWTNAVWANVITAIVKNDDDTLDAGLQNIPLGSNLQINYTYRSNANASDATFYVDIDRNPYNDNNAATAATENLSATGNSITASSQNWTVEGLTVGEKYYIYSEINDGTRKRFLYLPYEFIIDEAQNINTTSEKDIIIYPNPTSGIINLTGFNEPINFKNIEITDITGKTIQQFNYLTNGQINIDISSQPSGIYFLKINTDKNISHFKIIKK